MRTNHSSSDDHSRVPHDGQVKCFGLSPCIFSICAHLPQYGGKLSPDKNGICETSALPVRHGHNLWLHVWIFSFSPLFERAIDNPEIKRNIPDTDIVDANTSEKSDASDSVSPDPIRIQNHPEKIRFNPLDETSDWGVTRRGGSASIS